MKNHSFRLLFLSSTLFLFCACGQKSDRYSYEQMAASDTTTRVEKEEQKEPATVSDKKPPARQFIRTAKIKGKVEQVEKVTYAIERLIQKKGGFVEESNLQRNEEYPVTTPIGKDSLLETTRFVMTSHATFRIPNLHFDSSLYEIAQLLLYLNERTVKAEDVSLQMLSNQLTQKRVKRHEKRVSKSVDSKPGKIEEALKGEDAIYSLGETGDIAYVQNLSLEDQVQYSTITVNLYQTQQVQYKMLPNYSHIEKYELPFGARLWEALLFSWKILEEAFVLIAHIWWVLGGIVLCFLYYQKRKKSY